MISNEQSKVFSFRGAEYVEDEELQDWQATFLEAFFSECPLALDQFKGPVYRQLLMLKARARLAALDDTFRLQQLREFEVIERGVCLAIFTCFRCDSEGKWRHRIRATHLAKCNEEHLPDLISFRDEFLGWLRQYNLDRCEWLIETLLESLGDYDQLPELFKSDFHADRNRSGWVVESKAFEFNFRKFELTGEYLSAYRKSLEEAFHEALDGHFKSIEHLAAERGLKSAKDKAPEHFTWLVRYLAIGNTFEQIGKSSTSVATSDAVRKAVTRLAEHLQLELPPDRKGRPRKPITGQVKL